MHAGPRPFQPVQRVGLQRRDDGSQGREVFSNSALLSDVDPALDDPCSDMWSDLPVLQHRADHTGRHGIKLRNRGPNGGGAVLVVLLIPLGPDGTQAVVGHHLFKQQLEPERTGLMLA